ncbi:hypothetical protein CO657_19865 [Rhizobium acidisoli]|uniref:Uncharacterized protein n=1 Tax=Rhizobium acidisoli TaxID=1538158 RepID=A0AAE5TZM2_9HYPH|nr:hypothetical protein [Rhizobium acidisoli]KPH09100.1 hypothetical protein AOG23_07415 [Rhizobium acidisoli]QAS80189.1 hypothetical protein CO657_19865 [Rhizobium acidisoli]
MAKRKRRSRAVNLTSWQKSARFRQIGSEAIKAFHAIRYKLPKCTAIAKVSRERCGNLAMTNGKCWCHGGRTPSGDGWHKPVWPADGPGGERKLNRKLAAIQRSSKRRERKLAKASAEERQKYDVWQKSHHPGSKADRARKRKERQDAAAFKASTEASAKPPSNPELDELERELAAARRRAAALEINLTGNRGIFG